MLAYMNLLQIAIQVSWGRICCSDNAADRNVSITWSSLNTRAALNGRCNALKLAKIVLKHTELS